MRMSKKNEKLKSKTVRVASVWMEIMWDKGQKY
jgi:hypothetical protein